MSSPEQRHRRFLIAGIAAAVLLPIATIALVAFRADERWQALLQLEQQLQRDWARRDFARDVAWGTADDGNAFAHYARAEQGARDRAGSDKDALLATLRFDDARVATAAAPLLERWQPVLDAMRCGAHAANATPPDTAIANLLDCRHVVNVAMFAVRAARHRGEHLAAARLTLDTATYAADVVRRGVLINQMIGAALLAIATGETWPERALDGLDRDALDLLAAGLERIDRQLPVYLDHTGELLSQAQALRRGLGDPALPTSALTRGAWRFGFSGRWMIADAFLRTAAMMQELGDAQQLPWPQRCARIELEIAGLVQGGNPAMTAFVPNLAAAETSLRQAVAMLRLLRMSVDLHRGLDLPPLPDPLADGPIVVTPGHDGVRLECVGAAQRALLARDVRR